MSDTLELLSSHACFGGEQRYYRHASREIRESEAKLGQSLRRLSGGGLGAGPR